MIRRLICYLTLHSFDSIISTDTHQIVRCPYCGLTAAVEHRLRTVSLMGTTP